MIIYYGSNSKPDKISNDIDSLNAVIYHLENENEKIRLANDSLTNSIKKLDSMRNADIKRLYAKINAFKFNNNTHRRMVLDSILSD